MDPAFFVYYDECDFAKRLADAGWHSLFVPGAEAVHHDQLSTDLAEGLPRIVEFHRNRDLYMRKHHGAGGGARGPRSSPPGPTPCAPSPRPSSPANPPTSTGPTPARRSSPSAANRSATEPRRVVLSRDATDADAIGLPAHLRDARVLVHALGLVGLGDAAVDGAGLARRRWNEATSSPGWRRRASQTRSSGVKKPLAKRASG